MRNIDVANFIIGKWISSHGMGHTRNHDRQDNKPDRHGQCGGRALGKDEYVVSQNGFRIDLTTFPEFLYTAC